MNLPADFTRLTAENPADPEKKFSIRFTPPPIGLNPNPPRVVLDAPEAAPPVAVPFLTPFNRKAPARKTHRLIQHGDGSRTLETTGYGGADGTAKAARFTHCTRQVADIEDLHTVLRFHSDQNCLAVRGQVRPDAARVIFRRLAEEGADILDSGSRLVVIDLDHEVAPVALDTDDDLAVGEYLRSRLPAELRDVSCVVQFSNSYGLWRLDAGRKKELKAHLWLLNDEPLTGPELRRWITAQNRIGDCAQVDPQLSNANQAIYCAHPVFEGCADPVRQRLFLMLSDTGRDTASIRPPAAPEPIVYAPGAVGERCPDKLRPLVAAIQRAVAEGLERHPVINAAAFTAGRLVRGGAFTAEEARAALMPAAMDSGSAGADRTVNDGLLAGMTRGAPILVGGQRITDLSALPTAWQPEPVEAVTLDVAESRIAGIIQDVIARPRNAANLLRIAVINSTVGCGKTKIAIDEFKRDAKPVIWFAGTHAKSDETEADFNKGTPRNGLNQHLPWPAKAIRGRGAPLEVGDEKRVYCQKPDALKAVNDARLGQYAKSLLCINTHSQCPHLKGCDYFQQFHVASDCRILTHDYLIREKAEALRFAADIAVVDESPIHCLVLPKSIIWSDVVNPKHKPIAAWLKTAVGRAVYGAVMDGVALQPDEVARLLLACDEELAAFEVEGPAVQPWMDNESTAATIARWTPVGDMAVRSVLLAARRYLAGDVNTLWRGSAEGKPALFSRFAHVPTALRDKAVLILDATADADIYRAAMAGIRDKNGVISHAVEFHNIVVANAPGVTVTQVFDQTFYLGKLTKGPSAKKMAARVAGFIALAGGGEVIVNRHGAKQSAVGLISNKEFVRAVTAKTPCESLNFNALAGMNSLQDCRIGVIAGRTEPGALDLESAARALWPRETLNCTGVIEKQRSGYRTADGDFREGEVRGHADPRVDAVLRQTRDAELVQSIGRFRLVRATEAKQIFVLGNTPIPGLIVDRLVTTDDLLPNWRLAEALLAGHGTALLSANWLAEKCKDAFPNANQARLWIASFKGCFPGEYIYYPENSLSKLTEVTYFLEAQRGGKRRRAITTAQDLKAAAAAISALAGAPVRSIRWTDTEAPEAQPVTAAAPIETTTAPPPVVSTVETTPPPAPIFETAVMPELNPSTDPVIAIPPGVGNVLWMIGSPFFADWETPMAPHFGMECETRFTDWRVWFADGNTTTVIEHEPKTASEFWGWASGLTGAKQAAPIRGVAA